MKSDLGVLDEIFPVGKENDKIKAKVFINFLPPSEGRCACVPVQPEDKVDRHISASS